jgi:hypothetical protein
MIAWLLLPVLLSRRLAEPPPVAERTVRVELQFAEATSLEDGTVRLSSEMRTLDVMVGSDGRFRGRIVVDRERFAIKGTLTPQSDGSIKLKAVTIYAKKSGCFIPDPNGGPPNEFENRSEGKMEFSIRPGESTPLREGKSKSTANGITQHETKHRILLTVLNEPTE